MALNQINIYVISNTQKILLRKEKKVFETELIRIHSPEQPGCCIRSKGTWEISFSLNFSREPGTSSSDLFRFNSCSGILLSLTSRRTDASQIGEFATSFGQWDSICSNGAGFVFSKVLTALSKVKSVSSPESELSATEIEVLKAIVCSKSTQLSFRIAPLLVMANITGKIKQGVYRNKMFNYITRAYLCVHRILKMRAREFLKIYLKSTLMPLEPISLS